MSKPERVFVNTAETVDVYALVDGVYQKTASFAQPTDKTADVQTSFGVDLPFVDAAFVAGELLESTPEEPEEEQEAQDE
jgi:hypothetical protein